MGTIKLFEIPIYALSEKKLKEKVHQKEENLREKIKDEKAFILLKEKHFDVDKLLELIFTSVMNGQMKTFKIRLLIIFYIV